MRVLGINHIGIAPKDLGQARWFFEDVLGLIYDGHEVVTSQKTSTHMYASCVSPQSESVPRLELLEACPIGEGPIAKHLATRGSGVHHIALSVDDLESVLDHLKKLKVKMIDEEVKAGAHGTKVAFVHPHSTGGFLVELVEEAIF